MANLYLNSNNSKGNIKSYWIFESEVAGVFFSIILERIYFNKSLQYQFLFTFMSFLLVFNFWSEKNKTKEKRREDQTEERTSSYEHPLIVFAADKTSHTYTSKKESIPYNQLYVNLFQIDKEKTNKNKIYLDFIPEKKKKRFLFLFQI